MFNKLKQFKDLRSQAKMMQNMLANETVTVSRGGITAIVNGNMQLVNLTINENLAKDSLEGMIVECVNEALKKAQYMMAGKVKEMGGLPPGLT
jgi:DNA-binding protein YbaB